MRAVASGAAGLKQLLARSECTRGLRTDMRRNRTDQDDKK
jgi:hypothetical protein